MNCPHCHASVSEKAKFCPECGTSLHARCSNCGTENPHGAKFCAECGKPLAVGAAAAAPPAPTPKPVPAEAPVPADPLSAGERRQLTVMFCDVVNSTGLSEQLDPEELRDIMRSYQETCSKVIRRFDGFIAKYMGDGLLVHFGYPTAHEDDAQRAVRAGLGMLEALRYTEFRTSTGKLVPVDIRIGIHTGLVVIDQIGAESERKTDIIGETPNIAARLQSLAQPNTLVVSSSTYRLIAGFFEEEDLGPQPIKGISQPIGVYRILHEIAARTRLQARTEGGMTPMVGRDAEISKFKDLWNSVMEGEGQTLLICGEAGIGKSRITEALKLHVAHEHDAWLTETECSPYNQNTAFYPVSRLLQNTVLQFGAEDNAEARYAKLEGFLVQNGFDLNESVPLLAPILSLPANPNYAPIDPLALSTRQKTLGLLLNMLLRRAAVQPLLFIVEDLHWADPSTLDLLGLIINQAPGTRMLVYLTFRPEFKPPWIASQNVQLITLNRLAQGQSREMVNHLVEQKGIPEEIAIQILKKTDGVPLFIEELTRTLIEGGNLVLVNGDHYELNKKLEELTIPATLKDSLMARLDRLSTSKLVAQIAATIGREFSYMLLEAVAQLDEAVLQKELNQLASSGLIFQRGLPPTATYIFKHALVQDAAYESQLKSRRQEMHRTIASMLLKDFPDLAAIQPETLAIHYTEAGMLMEAVAEWLRAGQQASARSASQEAITDYHKGLELLRQLPADSPAQAYELPLQVYVGIALLMSRGYSAPEVAAPLSRARELCASVPDSPALPLILWSLWAYHVVRADHKQSYPLAEELWRVSQERNDEAIVIEASFPMGFEAFLRNGDFKQCVVEMSRIRALYRVEKHSAPVTGYVQDVLACGLSWEGWAEFILGHPGQARAILAQNVAHHRSLGHPYSSAYAGVCTGALAVLMENLEGAEEYGNEAMKVSVERGYPFFLGIASYVLGWAKGKAGNFEESMRLFDQGITVWNAMGSLVWRTLPYTWKIDVHLMFDDYAGARETLDAAYREVEQTQERFALSPLWRQEADTILGLARTSADASETLSQAGPSVEQRAEQLYRDAIANAREREAKSFELPALLRLYELLKGSPKAEEVIADIQKVYDSYPDGHELPLLQRAQSVLQSAGGVASKVLP